MDLNILLLIRNNKMKSAVLKEVQEPMEMYRYPTFFKNLPGKSTCPRGIVPLWSLNAEGIANIVLGEHMGPFGVRSGIF